MRLEPDGGVIAPQNFLERPEKQMLGALRLNAVAETFAETGAEADAIRLQPMSADCWLLLRDNDKLNFPCTPAEEVNAYQEAFRLSGIGMSWQCFTAALAVAGHQTDGARSDEASTVLRVFDAMPDVSPSLRVRLLRGRAHAPA